MTSELLFLILYNMILLRIIIKLRKTYALLNGVVRTYFQQNRVEKLSSRTNATQWISKPRIDVTSISNKKMRERPLDS